MGSVLASPPMKPSPIAKDWSDFDRYIVPAFATHYKEIQRRLTPKESKRREELREGIEACLAGLRSDREAIQDALSKGQKAELADLLQSVVVTLSDLRGCLDELVIEAMADGTLKSDAALMDSLDQFWWNERRFRLRFHSFLRNMNDEELPAPTPRN